VVPASISPGAQQIKASWRGTTDRMLFVNSRSGLAVVSLLRYCNRRLVLDAVLPRLGSAPRLSAGNPECNGYFSESIAT
jgi:hypothetical protein